MLEFASAVSTSLIADVGFVVIGVLGIIGIIGTVSAYFYKGRADALIALQEKEIKVLQDNNAAVKEQNEELRQQREQWYKERDDYVAEQKRMKREIATLRSVITQPKKFNELAQTLATQHSEVIGKLAEIAEGLVNHDNESSNTTE